MKQRSAAAILILFVLAFALLANPPFDAQAAGADSSLVVATLHVVEQNYVKQVDPVRLLNGAVAALRKATKQGEDVLPDIPTGTQEAQAIGIFRREFDQAVKVGNASETDLAYTSTRGMLDSLHDSHVYYMDPDQFKRDQEEMAGKVKYAGVGVVFKVLKADSGANEIFITDVFSGSPAAAVGLKQFDRITGVDGTPFPAAISSDDAAKQIRGPEGSTATLAVQRGGQTLTVPIVRASIQFPPVEVRRIQPGVVYIKLYSFSDGVGNQLRQLLKQAMAQGTIRAVILDLRGNLGGWLKEAESVAGIFLPTDTMLVRILRRTEDPTVQVARGELLLPKTPLAVLTDKSSASSSEVVVEGLKNTHRATVVGEKTAGELGSASRFSLPAGGMWVTTKELVGPQYEQIERVGIAPDTEVELSVSDMERGVDTQLDAALKAVGGVNLLERTFAASWSPSIVPSRQRAGQPSSLLVAVAPPTRVVSFFVPVCTNPRMVFSPCQIRPSSVTSVSSANVFSSSTSATMS